MDLAVVAALYHDLNKITFFRHALAKYCILD